MQTANRKVGFVQHPTSQSTPPLRFLAVGLSCQDFYQDNILSREIHLSIYCQTKTLRHQNLSFQILKAYIGIPATKRKKLSGNITD